MKKYILGRTIILWSVLLQFLTTIALMSMPLQSAILLPANIFEHVLAVAFFAGLLIAIWGLFIKREYTTYQFSYWDILCVLLVLVFTFDNWYILATPHPLFSEYYI
jgi:hypothetical protein